MLAGRLSADIIADKLQGSQAKELRSFALLNLTWSSIVRLLQVLATAPDQPCITTGMHRWCSNGKTDVGLASVTPGPWSFVA